MSKSSGDTSHFNTNIHNSRILTPQPTSFQFHESMQSVSLNRGVPLTQTRSIKTLIVTLIHAVIVHYICFESGWLLCDISFENVLHVSSGLPMQLPPPFAHFEWKNCHALLTGLNLAARWDCTSDEGPVQSGTLSFLSYHALYSCILEEDYERSPADDLEGISWLLFSTALSRAKNPTDAEIKLKDQLKQATTPEKALSANQYIFGILVRPTLDLTQYPNIGFCFPLVRSWITLAREHTVTLMEAKGFFKRDGKARPREEVVDEELKNLYLPFVNQGVAFLRDYEELEKI